MKNKNNKILGIGAAALVLALVVPTTITTTTTAAYGQELPESVFFTDPNERTDKIISEVLTKLQNAGLNHTNFQMIGMWEDGKLHLYLDNGTPGDPTDDTIIMTTHEYTTENGYQFQDDVIVAPNGSELFSD